MTVQTVAHLDTDASPQDLFEAVGVLDGYDRWLDIVGAVRAAGSHSDDPGPAWLVDLRGQIGPLRRSKRLRMVRTEHHPPEGRLPGRVRYERRELDGRVHSPWTLDALVSSRADSSSHLEMTLYYGGSLWVPMMERMLRDEIQRSRPRLLEHLRDR